MSTPRVFIMRHGETEWSLNGRHTSTTDIPLTADGEKRIRATGRALVGNDRLIVPQMLDTVLVSPRQRAIRTFELLNVDLECHIPWESVGPAHPDAADRLSRCGAEVRITGDVREWDYGDYEGLTSKEIREQRAAAGLSGRWDIWKDGCPGGESPEQVTDRLDGLIEDIRLFYHEQAFAAGLPCDILIVAHGHILRALALRWVGASLDTGPTFLLETGGVGILTYEHNSINEPAILLGGAFRVSPDTQ